MSEDWKCLPSQRSKIGAGMLMWDCIVHLLLAAPVACSYAAVHIAGRMMGAMTVQVQ